MSSAGGIVTCQLRICTGMRHIVLAILSKLSGEISFIKSKLLPIRIEVLPVNIFETEQLQDLLPCPQRHSTCRSKCYVTVVLLIANAGRQCEKTLIRIAISSTLSML